MVQYVITPWRERGELLRVREQLYPAPGSPISDVERREAVAQVSVWMHRGNCPHLVESTAILTSAVLNDVPGNSAYCVRAAYSAAFCRFVTGLLDSYQDKRRKLSMYSIAKTIGLPATYVELRHRATHEELPSLPKLRTAAHKALRWIWDYYWSTLPVETPDTADCKSYIVNILEESDERTRQEREETLKNWNEDQILGALMEIDAKTDNPAVLLRSLRLSEKIIDRDREKTGKEDTMHILDQTTSNLDEVKAELAAMEEKLNQSRENDSQQLDTRNNSKFEVTEKGWAMWEGPWVLKPIGIV